jgi:hypothetical protein
MNKTAIYNTSYEIGIRVLTLLDLTSSSIDLQRIIYYDYLMLHYGDIDKNYESLHPANPFHATELYVRRGLIQAALDLISRKGLVIISFSNNGFLYNISDLGKDFIECFDSDYFIKLKKYALLVVEKFDSLSDQSIHEYISVNVGKWKDEFENESLFRGENLE